MRNTLLLVFALLLLGGSGSFAAFTPERRTLDLAGAWRFSPEDRPEFARADYDDARWQTIRLPGFWEDQGFPDHDGYAWLRRTVRVAPQAGMPVALCLGQVYDAVELFVNGKRVGEATGAIGHGKHLFPLDSPARFDLDGVLREGENVLALRVYDDPAREYWVWSNLPFPTGQGKGGIGGEIAVETAPAVYVRDVRVEAARKGLPQSRFRFTVSLKNRGKAAAPATVTLRADGRVHTAKVTVPVGSTDTAFDVEARPQFGQKTYTVAVSAPQGQDQVTGTWHSVVVEARAGGLFVNGEPFVVKGLNGTLAMNPEAAASQARLLQECNVNTLRSHCLGMWFKQAQQQADLFLLPLVTDMSCCPLSRWQEPGMRDRMLREMRLYIEHVRDNPWILGWNSANEVDERNQKEGMIPFLQELYQDIHQLDGWQRPVVYSNLGHQEFTAGQDLVGFNYYVDPNDFDFTRLRPLLGEKPFMLTECDLPGPFWREPYWENVPLHTQVNQGIWEKSTTASGSGATLFSGLFDYGGRHVGLLSGSTEKPPYGRVREDFRDFVRWLYRDFDAEVQGAWEAGKSATLRLTNRMPFALRDLRLECDSNRAATIPLLTPGQQITCRLTAGTERVRATYTTHGGMRHQTSFDPLHPWQQPAVVLPEEQIRTYRVLTQEPLSSPEAWGRDGSTSAAASAEKPEIAADPTEEEAVRLRFSFGAPGRSNDWVRYALAPRRGDFTGWDGLAVRLKNDGKSRRLLVVLFDKGGDETAVHARRVISGNGWETHVFTFKNEFEMKPGFDRSAVQHIRFQFDDYVPSILGRGGLATGDADLRVGSVSLVKVAQ